MFQTLVPRQRDFLQVLLREGRASRRDLHERLGIRPNTVGKDAAVLIEQGLVRELPGRRVGRGRPRVPLEIDPERKRVVGICLHHGEVQAQTLDLRGHPAGPVVRKSADASSINRAAADICRSLMAPHVLAVGVSSHGQSIGRAAGDAILTNLSPLRHAVGPAPLVRGSDVNAVAARWLIQHSEALAQHVLLVAVEDGYLRAALLANGRPNRDDPLHSHEVGHTRFPTDTDPCTCGRSGCLIRVFCTAWVQQDGDSGTLAERIAVMDGKDERLIQAVDVLALGLTNAANLLQVDRLIIVSSLLAHQDFRARLQGLLRENLYHASPDRPLLDLIEQPAIADAASAGALALVPLYYDGWLGNAGPA